MNEDVLEALYGPAAPHSEHKRGEVIRFYDKEADQVREGTIIWVRAADPVRQFHLHYIVDAPGFSAAVVFPGEVIAE
jgi:hypothetical protein